MGDYAEALRRAENAKEPIAGEDPPIPAAPTVLATNPAPPIHSIHPQATAAAPVIIPRTRSGDWAARAVLADSRGATAEGYRYFAVRLMKTLEPRGTRSVLITSALRHEGKTTTACNLALALASMTTGDRIALVDLDLHQPSVGRSLSVSPRVGFERVLSGEVPPLAARLQTNVPHLDLFLTSAPQLEAHGSLSNRHFAESVHTLAEEYRFVIFDTPPVLLFPDVPLIAEHVGACVTVARSGHTRRAAYREMLALIPNERHVGSFLNQKRSPRHLREYGEYVEQAGSPISEQKK